MDLAEALKNHENTPMGLLQRLTLPDGISLYELDQRLEKWIQFHRATLLSACIHALRLPDDIARAQTHLLFIKVRACAQDEHGGSARKHFAILDAYPVEVAEALTWKEPWPESIEQLRLLQATGMSKSSGAVAGVMIECPPLAVQTVPFGSIKGLEFLVVPDWKDVLIAHTKAGKHFQNMSYYG